MSRKFPAKDMILPLKSCLDGREDFGEILRAWIGFGVAFLEGVLLLDPFLEMALIGAI